MTDDDAPAASIITPREIGTILYRRRYWLLIPMILGLLITTTAAFVLSPTYRSSATLLIDSQQVPTALVASPLTSYADERIAKIRQQIMSRENLAALVRTHDLYAEERRRLSLDNVLAIMRNDIGVDLVGAKPNAGGAPGGAVIAFTLSFTYHDPVVARDVTQRLTSMFIDEDKRLRTEQASGTESFLARHANALRDQLVALESRRRGIEAKYAGALPDQVALSAQASATLGAEVSRIDAETQGIMQQNSLLAARSQQSPVARDDGLHRAQERLTQLTSVYSDSYPEVAAAKVAVARQRALARQDNAGASENALLATEVAAGRSHIAMLAARRAQLVQSAANMERMAALAPQAAYELNNLERDNDNLKRQYQDIREKQLEAQVAANLQTEGKGERFSLVDAPSLSFDPISPKRLQMILMGLFGGLGLGLAAVVVREFVTGTVNGEGGIARLMGEPPLVVVPMLRNGAEIALLDTARRFFTRERWSKAA